jgi:hypothetical protein
MSQKFNGILPKFTFGEFGIQVVASQSLKNNMEMFRMIFQIFRIDQNIINEDHTNLLSSCMKTEFMRYMKYAGALVRPNDMTRYS